MISKLFRFIPLVIILALTMMVTSLVLADPISVTIAGSFQNELGCPGDWQPDCPITALTNVGNGVWRAEYTVPAGNWEYKMPSTAVGT